MESKRRIPVMNQLEELCQLVLEQLSKEGYTTWGITRHTRTYNALCKYATSEGINTYSDDLAQLFITEKYQADMDARRGQNTQFVTQRITHLLKLGHFQKTGNIHYCSKSGQKQKQRCPGCFKYIWSAYIETLVTSNYAETTITRLRFQSLKFLQYLYDYKIDDLNEISYEIISRYLLLHMKHSKNYLKTITSCLKSFFQFLFEEEITTIDYQLLVPTIHLNREAFLPSSLEPDEIVDIIGAVDTTTAIGKRDLALLLLASQMGIRISDIKNLRIKDFNWKHRTLSIIQQKTGHMLHVPIPIETGWAIINYMKYGRPTSDDDHLFVRHSPDGGAFSSRNKLQDILHKYMRKANIIYPLKEHRGFHSLRSGYAKTLLKKGTPLPVISDLLGHTSTLTTSHYLRIDIFNLKQCAIDIEEVLQND